MTQRVVIVNNSGQNFKDAARFGTIYNLTKGRLNLSDLTKLKYNLLRKLETLNENDIFVVTGPTVLNIIVADYYLKKFETMRILGMSRDSNGYHYKVQTIEGDKNV